MSVRSPDQIDIAIGLQVRVQRRMIGMSQTALADRLGITFQQVQKYENGSNRMSVGRLQAIATALNVDPAEFFVAVPTTASAFPATPLRDLLAEMLAVDSGIDLADAFVALPDSQTRRMAVTGVQALGRAAASKAA